MRRRLWRCLLLRCVSIAPVQAARLDGFVIKVVDGDTFDLRLTSGKVERIRLGAIDAPELAQPFGRRSAAALRQIALRRPVSVVVSKRDSHGRAVGRARVASASTCPSASSKCERNLDLALAQLESGMAWHYTHFAAEQPPALRAHYAAAERRSRASRRGLWNASHPIAPWDWRRRSPP